MGKYLDRIGSVIPAAEAQPPPEATVTSTPIARPGKPSRPFLVAIDGITCCPACGQAGNIPHHSQPHLLAVLDA